MVTVRISIMMQNSLLTYLPACLLIYLRTYLLNTLHGAESFLRS